MPPASRSPNKKPAAGAGQRPLRLWELLFRPRLFLFVILLAASMAVAPFVPVWWQRLRSQAEYRITPGDIVVNPPEAWVPDQLLQEIMGEFPPTMSLLDDSLVEQVAEAFQASPWIATVEKVQKTRDGIQVRVVYRRPLMFVQNELGFYPVDSEGVLLPPTDFTADDTKTLPVFLSEDSSPTGPAGKEWNDPTVLAAVSLVQCLVPEGDTSHYWKRFGLASLQVDRIAGDDTSPPSFLLHTTGGSEIVWGTSPREEFSPLEPTAEEKLARLELYWEQYGDFESPGGPYRIDIRHFEHIGRKPLDQSIR